MKNPKIPIIPEIPVHIFPAQEYDKHIESEDCHCDPYRMGEGECATWIHKPMDEKEIISNLVKI